MTCNDVSQLLDPFLDTELPPPMLLAVAKHAAGCTACDATIRELSDLRELLARDNAAIVDELDLRGVWPAVEAAIDRYDVVQARRRRIRALPMWGTAAAMAAGLMLWIGQASTQPRHMAQPVKQVARAERVDRPTSRERSILSRNVNNHTYIDRLRAQRAVDVRREPKSGTTIIWVNHTADVGR